MLNRFKAGNIIVSFKTNDKIGITEGNSYEVLEIRIHFHERFVLIKNDVNTLRELNENRFYLDTPENRRKLQIKKMFELYNVE